MKWRPSCTGVQLTCETATRWLMTSNVRVTGDKRNGLTMMWKNDQKLERSCWTIQTHVCMTEMSERENKAMGVSGLVVRVSDS